LKLTKKGNVKKAKAKEMNNNLNKRKLEPKIHQTVKQVTKQILRPSKRTKVKIFLPQMLAGCPISIHNRGAGYFVAANDITNC
jgi:hypothetical protein